MAVPCGATGVVHDYVPFYFGSLSPMLLGVINAKNVDQSDILYFEFPISIINRDGAVFTDASANTVISPNFYDRPEDLIQLNWKEIDSLKWKSDSEELRHQRMAEVLVPWHVSVQEATRIIVWNLDVKKRVDEIIAKTGKAGIEVNYESPNRRHWFKKFQPPEDKGYGLVTGPAEIAQSYNAAVDMVCETKRPVANALFSDCEELLQGLRSEFGCLIHTAELIGLQSENGVHKLTVDKHTLEVVERLVALPEFQEFEVGVQNLLELAAYLHDIGKGPKARWAWNNGLQKADADHPVRALPMLIEILNDSIAEVHQEDSTMILKLVCYHDLIGEVLGKGRSEQQIIDIIENELELKMLFAIGKADATSLSEFWWNQVQADLLFDRCLTKIMSKG